jgi:hypothetical protein
MTLSFSQKFKDGTPNYFIEKIWNGLIRDCDFSVYDYYFNEYANKFGEYWNENYTEILTSKIHTIRSGNRWKAGDKIHFVVNSRTKDRFQFAPVITAKSVQRIDITYYPESLDLTKKVKHSPLVRIDDKAIVGDELMNLVRNDGFNSAEQFFEWFSEDFEGQIIWFCDGKY